MTLCLLRRSMLNVLGPVATSVRWVELGIEILSIPSLLGDLAVANPTLGRRVRSQEVPDLYVSGIALFSLSLVVSRRGSQLTFRAQLTGRVLAQKYLLLLLVLTRLFMSWLRCVGLLYVSMSSVGLVRPPYVTQWLCRLL